MAKNKTVNAKKLKASTLKIKDLGVKDMIQGVKRVNARFSLRIKRLPKDSPLRHVLERHEDRMVKMLKVVKRELAMVGAVRS